MPIFDAPVDRRLLWPLQAPWPRRRARVLIRRFQVRWPELVYDMDLEVELANAQAFLEVQREFGSFDAYLWGFVDGRPLQNLRRSMKQVPARTPVSDAISKDLKRRGFRFVGSTIVYAYMQAIGMVNDHLATCFRRAQLAALPRPGSSAKLRRESE